MTKKIKGKMKGDRTRAKKQTNIRKKRNQSKSKEKKRKPDRWKKNTPGQSLQNYN